MGQAAGKTLLETSKILEKPISTIWRWEADFRDILSVPKNENGKKYFTEKEIETLELIKVMRSNGISKQKIREALIQSKIEKDPSEKVTKETSEVASPQEKSLTLYSPGEVAKMIGLEPIQLRRYVAYFGIKTKWSKPNEEGHRRYTKENVDQLSSIIEKMKKDQLSLEKVRDWYLGRSTKKIEPKKQKELKPPVTTNKQDSADELIKVIQQLRGLPEEVNKKLENSLEEWKTELKKELASEVSGLLANSKRKTFFGLFRK